MMDFNKYICKRCCEERIQLYASKPIYCPYCDKYMYENDKIFSRNDIKNIKEEFITRFYNMNKKDNIDNSKKIIDLFNEVFGA